MAQVAFGEWVALACARRDRGSDEEREMDWDLSRRFELMKTDKVFAAFFNNGHVHWLPTCPISAVYGRGRREQIERLTRLHPVVVGESNFDAEADALRDLQVIFTCWGIPMLTPEQLDRLPNLRAIFYASGSVKRFAMPYLERGVKVISAWTANADSVAEFCLGQILLSMKGYFRNTRDCRDPKRNRQDVAFHGKGVYGETIALIGAGKIARRLIQLLMPFNVRVLVVDPFLPPEEASALGVSVVSMEDAFREAYVVSNHLPDLPELKRVLNARLFRTMRNDATFINTGRGAQVNEAEFIEVLRERPDLTALLDVTEPQPCEPDSAFYCLPNVQLTSHLAGAHDDELVRMADMVIDEFQRWRSGEPLRHQITADMMSRIA